MKKLAFFGIILVIFTIVVVIYIFAGNRTNNIKLEGNRTLFKNQNPIDLERILNENSSIEIEEAMIVEEIDEEYTTLYVNNNIMPNGIIRVIEPGKDGKRQIVSIKRFENGEAISEEIISETLITVAHNKIVEIGTGGDEWNYSKTSITSADFGMDLNVESGLSLAEFNKILSGNSYDKFGIFEKNAMYFYYAEKQYKINGVALAAIGIHESGWGTSNIALNKMNIFGYGAKDSNPYEGAVAFSAYSECIDMVARVLVKYYLNSPGTQIYDGNIAIRHTL